VSLRGTTIYATSFDTEFANKVKHITR
jgi:hypothetical protein